MRQAIISSWSGGDIKVITVTRTTLLGSITFRQWILATMKEAESRREQRIKQLTNIEKPYKWLNCSISSKKFIGIANKIFGAQTVMRLGCPTCLSETLNHGRPLPRSLISRTCRNDFCSAEHNAGIAGRYWWLMTAIATSTCFIPSYGHFPVNISQQTYPTVYESRIKKYCNEFTRAMLKISTLSS